MQPADALEFEGDGPWARFANAFAASARSRWAWRALLCCLGLAVLAPFLANERPYFVRVRDAQGYREALGVLPTISESLVREVGLSPAKGHSPALDREAAALSTRLEIIEQALGPQGNADARKALSLFDQQVRALQAALQQGDRARCERLGAELIALAKHTAATLALRDGSGIRLVARSHWPLLAALSATDVGVLCLWLGLVSFRIWPRGWSRRGLFPRLLALLSLCLLSALLAFALPRGSAQLDAGVWESRLAADPQHSAFFAPIHYGPNETHLEAAKRPPTWTSVNPAFEGRHWLGTDALGRDLLARLLYAGRTSFAVALLASALIVTIGAALGLAAGTLRGVVETLVLRAIELLQAFPTLVLLLGLIALLPARAADSRWTMPLVIALLGWTHIARLARAEALRVSNMAFVRAAQAAGFSRAQVLLRHVLPNSLGPVWVAASFVLSAGLVLESSAAFLGFGLQHPAPSFGALLADARGGETWWLALFPGLWLFTIILCIHLVGEGVRDALDPRDAVRSA